MQSLPVGPWLKLLGAEPFLLPTKPVGAGEQQGHPSVSSAAAGIVNVHSFFYGPKDTAQRGADLVNRYRKSSTGRCSCDNRAAALNFTP